MSDKLTIGLFGFGVVGEGIYQILQQTPSLNASIKKICIKNAWKQRNAPADLFTTAYSSILDDPEINIVVELTNDPAEAYTIVTESLRRKKAVVSANKKLIADHFHELYMLQQQFQTPFLYEAAVAGSIPIIRNLEEYYDNDLLQAISGIINGSTNYILTKVIDEGLGFKEALLLAQQNGFAEKDPSTDVEGKDAVNKLTILLAHTYGISTLPENIPHTGITRIHALDVAVAKEKHYRIKLVAQAKKLSNNQVASFVFPQFVTESEQLYNVNKEFNGIVIESSFADQQFLYGKGAGRFPTASAVLSDISALRYQYRYEYRKFDTALAATLSTDYFLRIYISFPPDSEIDQTQFEWIEGYHCEEKRQYYVGVIHITALLEAEWFINPKVSCILLPDPIIEETSIKKLKKKSLELAAIF